MNTAFAADTTQLRTAERCSEIAKKPRVDPDHSSVDLARDRMRAAQIPRPDCSAQSVGRIIRHAHGFIVGIEWLDVTDRAEDFFTYTSRRLIKPRPYRRF